MKVTAHKRFIIDLSEGEANNLIWILDQLTSVATHQNAKDLVHLGDRHNDLIANLIENIENTPA